jgi:hypothetical protein
MGIPFTQYLLPDGRTRDEHIDRPADIEAIADRFIKSGGRYECEVLTTGEVSLTAVKDDDDVAIVLCQNAPGVGERVDELVRESERFI